MNNKKIFYILVCVLILGPFSAGTMALESDSEQPITIDSNSATYDEKKGTSIYIGNVISIQGSMTVNSAKLVAYLRGGEVYKLVWTGSPVRFKQKQDNEKEDLNGLSQKLEYYPDSSQMVLIDSAEVTQGSNTYTSDLIKYNSKTSVVSAGKKNTDSKRVRVVLKPKKKTEKTE